MEFKEWHLSIHSSLSSVSLYNIFMYICMCVYVSSAVHKYIASLTYNSLPHPLFLFLILKETFTTSIFHPTQKNNATKVYLVVISLSSLLVGNHLILYKDRKTHTINLPCPIFQPIHKYLFTLTHTYKIQIVSSSLRSEIASSLP